MQGAIVTLVSVYVAKQALKEDEDGPEIQFFDSFKHIVVEVLAPAPCCASAPA